LGALAKRKILTEVILFFGLCISLNLNGILPRRSRLCFRLQAEEGSLSGGALRKSSSVSLDWPSDKTDLVLKCPSH
jgi:hypothetical protein